MLTYWSHLRRICPLTRKIPSATLRRWWRKEWVAKPPKYPFSRTFQGHFRFLQPLASNLLRVDISRRDEKDKVINFPFGKRDSFSVTWNASLNEDQTVHLNFSDILISPNKRDAAQS